MVPASMWRCMYEKREFGHRDRHARREDDAKTHREDTMCRWRRRVERCMHKSKAPAVPQEARRETRTHPPSQPSVGSNTADPSTLDSSLRNRGSTLLSFQPHSFRYFDMTALGNEYTLWGMWALTCPGLHSGLWCRQERVSFCSVPYSVGRFLK